jgi:DNA-binding transcriptional LysR family regulator
MNRYRASYPGIALALIIGNTETVADTVRDGAADLGFVEGPVDDQALSVTPVAEDEMVLVVSPALTRPKGSSLSKADLKALRWVFREPGSATRALFEKAMAKAGLRVSDINMVLELPSNEAVRAAVEDGAGAAILSKLVVAASIEAGSLIDLNFVLPKRQFFALHHKERSITQAERELLKIVGELSRPVGHHSTRSSRRENQP